MNLKVGRIMLPARIKRKKKRKIRNRNKRKRKMKSKMGRIKLKKIRGREFSIIYLTIQTFLKTWKRHYQLAGTLTIVTRSEFKNQ